MVREAESHAQEDKKRRELAEARNQLDSLIYTTEKSLKEYGDKIDAGDKQNIEDAITKSKKAMESNDIGSMKSAQDDLTRSSHKLAEAMYSKASKGAAGPGAETEAQGGPRQKAQEDVVDADYEDVKK
jgi:molecular chaperone DnaK